MKLVIGLGNPGERYKNSRHNVGQMFVDYAKNGIKTDCFMNESGKFVKKHLTNLTDLYIVHDDLDLPLRQYKIQLGVGPKIHYGVNSVEEALGTKNFWRVRIGVDNRAHSAEAPRAKGDEYVLQDFTKEEMEILKGVFDAILKDDSFPH